MAADGNFQDKSPTDLFWRFVELLSQGLSNWFVVQKDCCLVVVQKDYCPVVVQRVVCTGGLFSRCCPERLLPMLLDCILILLSNHGSVLLILLSNHGMVLLKFF